MKDNEGTGTFYWISCDGCSDWYHYECIDMSKEVLKYFEIQKKPYICNKCAGELGSLFKAKDFLTNLGDKMVEIEKQMAEMSTKVEHQEKKTDYKTNVEFKETVWEQMNQFKADEEEKNYRKSNIIIRGMEEENVEDPREKRIKDEKSVKNQLKTQALMKKLKLNF